jgi:hypothetical protein
MADLHRVKYRGQDVFHLVAKIQNPRVCLTDFGTGTWMWTRLREAFPEALGTTLMGDHPHVLSPLDSPEEGRARLNRLLGQLARRFGLRHVGAAPLPKRIEDRGKLLLDCRYLALNPSRKNLVGDPLQWWFSTHRDVMGAIADPWVTAGRLAAALRRRRSGFESWYHGYVSADPSVDVAGTAPPAPATPTVLSTVPLATIARAAAAAHRAHPSAHQDKGPVRDHFVALAWEQGWRNLDQLAAVCHCRPRAIRRTIARTDPAALAPARLCLGDRRLLSGFPRKRRGSLPLEDPTGVLGAP